MSPVESGASKSRQRYDGKAPFAYEKGPKDTVYVGEGKKVRVIGRFELQQGKYMMHCHSLVHEDHDMMVAFEVARVVRAKPLRLATPL